MIHSLYGDAPFEVAGQQFTMRFGGSALMALEDAFPEHGDFTEVFSYFAALNEAGKSPPMRAIAKLVRCALVTHHPDITIEEAADLAALPEAQAALAEAVARAMPKAEGGDGADADPPKKAKRGAGNGH